MHGLWNGIRKSRQKLKLKMKKLITLLSAVLFSVTAFSQAYSSPESVEFDYANNRWFISNNGSGQILERNSVTGVRTVFASGIPSGPHGLEIVNDTLYACDGGFLKGYNINTGALVLNINFGASFLNGITHDTSGNIYATDYNTSQRKIYRYTVATRQFNVFVASTVSQPNGIIFDPSLNRLIFVNWGTSAPIKAVNLLDSTISTIITSTLSNCDGIARDGAGNYFISSYSSNTVTRFNGSFGSPTLVISTGLSAPADLFYNTITDTLGVPNSGSGNNTKYYYFGSPTSINESSTDAFLFSVYPNPIAKTAEIKYQIMEEGNVKIEMFDVTGKVVKTIVNENQAKGAHSINFDKSSFSAGNYFFTISNASGTETKKIVIVE